MSNPATDLASEGDINITPRRAAWQRAELDDASETDPDHALQAAERRLQIEIQKALTAKEAIHG